MEFDGDDKLPDMGNVLLQQISNEIKMETNSEDLKAEQEAKAEEQRRLDLRDDKATLMGIADQLESLKFGNMKTGDGERILNGAKILLSKVVKHLNERGREI